MPHSHDFPKCKLVIEQDKIPWTDIMKSPAVWALLVTNVCFDWTLYTFLTNLPTYMKEILHFNLQQNTLLSCIPFLGLFAMAVISGCVSDRVGSTGMLTTAVVRKVNTTLGTLFPAVLLIALDYINCSQQLLGFVLLVTAISFLGFVVGAGFTVDHTDIAPKFAPVLYGMSNGLAAIPGLVAPTLIGFITKDKTEAQWRIVFCMSAAITAFGSIFCVMTGSGEVQGWATENKEQEEFVESYKLNKPSQVGRQTNRESREPLNSNRLDQDKVVI